MPAHARRRRDRRCPPRRRAEARRLDGDLASDLLIRGARTYVDFGEGITPEGGGAVPDSEQPPASWRLATAQVSSVELAPRRAAVLLG